MADLENIIQQGESIKDKKLTLFGLRVSGASIMGLFALLSGVLGSLYGGFLLYQKVESLAQLDLGSITSQMLKTEAAVTRIEEHANSIKIELKKDMNDLRNSQYSLESRMDNKISSQDSKMTAFDQRMDLKLTSYDDKLFKFDQKVEKTKEDLEKRIQQSLDNPLNY